MTWLCDGLVVHFHSSAISFVCFFLLLLLLLPLFIEYNKHKFSIRQTKQTDNVYGKFTRKLFVRVCFFQGGDAAKHTHTHTCKRVDHLWKRLLHQPTTASVFLVMLFFARANVSFAWRGKSRTRIRKWIDPSNHDMEFWFVYANRPKYGKSIDRNKSVGNWRVNLIGNQLNWICLQSHRQ